MERKALMRFVDGVDFTDTCWNWTRFLSGGYGFFYEEGVQTRVHRVAYKWWVGELCEGMVIDHLCKNKKCVNPEHLEQVTSRENIYRVYGSTATHCPMGHSRAAQIKHVRGDSNCWKCAKIRGILRNL